MDSAHINSAGDVSVIVVTMNGDDLLASCLASLARIYGTDLEIVVVDNANAASTRALVTRFPNATYVAAHANLGFAGGNALGWRRVTRPYVVLLNNDTVLTGDSISPLVAYLAAHSKCAAVQGTVVFADRPHLTDGTGMWFSPIGVLAPEGVLTPLAVAPKAAREVFSVGGAFCALRRKAIGGRGGDGTALLSALQELLRGSRPLPSPVAARLGLRLRADATRPAPAQRDVRATGLGGHPRTLLPKRLVLDSDVLRMARTPPLCADTRLSLPRTGPCNCGARRRERPAGASRQCKVAVAQAPLSRGRADANPADGDTKRP